MNSQAPPARERLNFIYIIRAIAIIGVIMVHVTSTPAEELTEYSSYPVYNMLNVLFRFGTTTFLFLSAFVLFYNYYNRKLNVKLLVKFYKRRLLYIVIPYVIWSAAYYVFQLHMTGGWDYIKSHAAISALKDMILSGDAYYHLYFIYINAQFYIVFPLLLWLFQRFPAVARHLIWIGAAMQAAFAIANIYVFQFEDKGSMALSYISYYFLGAYFGIFYDKIKGWFNPGKLRSLRYKMFTWPLVWTSWLASVGFDAYLWFVMRTEDRYFDPLWYEFSLQLRSLLTIVVLMHASHMIMSRPRGRWIQPFLHLGTVSFGIYIVHAGILSFYMRYMPTVEPRVYHWYIALSFVLTLSLAWIIVGVIAKYFKSSWVLFGQTPKVPDIAAASRAYPMERTARKSFN